MQQFVPPFPSQLNSVSMFYMSVTIDMRYLELNCKHVSVFINRLPCDQHRKCERNQRPAVIRVDSAAILHRDTAPGNNAVCVSLRLYPLTRLHM